MTAKKSLSRPKKKARSVVTTSVGLLAKSLASNDFKTREYSQRDVQIILTETELTSEEYLDYTDILGICKGLHYSLWMQDKFIRKEEVVARICDILTGITRESTCCYYFQAVLETLAREWEKMDKWQEDKFMLLSRDFFTRGLLYFPAHNIKLWHAFLDAVFYKILNGSIYQAVGLKLHMCNVLYEELSKKKVKAVCVVSTLSKCIDQLTRLPKHNSYTDSMLKLIHRLQRIVKRHSTADLTQVINQLDRVSSLKTPHQTSLSRVAKVIRSLVRKQAILYGRSASLCNKLSTSTPCDSLAVVAMTDPVQDVDLCERMSSPEISADTSSLKEPCNSDSGKLKKPLKKRVKTIKNKKTKNKCPPAALPEGIPECPMDLICSDESVDPSCSTASDMKETSVPSFSNTETTITDTTIESTTPLQRRVSFGKVYRKKFISGRRLPLTPTVLTTPSKGILREQGISRQSRRISL